MSIIDAYYLLSLAFILWLLKRGEIVNNFGNILKELRLANNLTQKEIGDYLGVSRATVGGYETKGKQPDYETLIALSKYFKVTIDYLLGNDNKFDMLKGNNGLTIEKKLEDLVKEVENTKTIMFRGHAIDDITKNIIQETLSYSKNMLYLSIKKKNKED